MFISKTFYRTTWINRIYINPNDYYNPAIHISKPKGVEEMNDIHKIKRKDTQSLNTFKQTTIQTTNIYFSYGLILIRF